MPRPSSRSGYTLVELMVAATISIILIAGVAGALVTTMRLVSVTMAETEFALAGRELRDKLLFHAVPDAGGLHYAGLLSATNANTLIEGGWGGLWNGPSSRAAIPRDSKLVGNCIVVGAALDDERSQRFELMVRNANPGYAFANDADRRTPNWLRAGGLLFPYDYAALGRVTEEGRNKREQTYPRRFHLDVTYRHHPPYLPSTVTNYDLVRAESIVVPVMGKVHRRAFTNATVEVNAAL